MTGKKIALLGTAPASMELAPFQDLSWEIWACSYGTMNMPRISQRFELHRWNPKDVARYGQPYIQYLQNFDGPVWMAKKYDDIRNCHILPWKALVRKYSPYFFTSSIAWMFAMAIEQEPSAIHLYGIDMATNQEYKDQRMGLQYFALLAQTKGIEIYAPAEADVFAPAPLYGICETSHEWWKQRTRLMWMNGERQRLAKEIAAMQEQQAYYQGCLDEQDYNFRSWFGNEAGMSQNFERPAQCTELEFPHNTSAIPVVPLKGDKESA